MADESRQENGGRTKHEREREGERLVRAAEEAKTPRKTTHDRRPQADDGRMRCDAMKMSYRRRT
eukprot:32278-Pyramimonas_sp.AAC.1